MTQDSDVHEIFEAAILFTDLHGSSQLVASTTTPEFFRILNAALSAQGRVVRAHGGRVLKYTGDGLMAVFRGDARAALALRCACELGRPAAQGDTPYSIGVAEGRVLAGWMGDASGDGLPRQFDVIGATVHVAARLCELAAPGEVIATRRTASLATLPLAVRDIGALQVRGFELPIDCVAIQPGEVP